MIGRPAGSGRRELTFWTSRWTWDYSGPARDPGSGPTGSSGKAGSSSRRYAPDTWSWRAESRNELWCCGVRILQRPSRIKSGKTCNGSWAGSTPTGQRKQSMNRRQIIAVGVLVVPLITGTWAVARVQESNDNTYSNIERFIQVLTKVRDNYVEPVSSDKLMDAAIRGMLRTLDPYSQYLDKDEAERLETTTHGAFGGIGISIGMRDG